MTTGNGFTNWKSCSLVLFLVYFLCPCSMVAMDKLKSLSPFLKENETCSLAIEKMSKKEFVIAEGLFSNLIEIAKSEGTIQDELILKNLQAKCIMHQWRTEEALSQYLTIREEAKKNDLDSLHADVITAITTIYKFQEKTDAIRPLVEEGLKLKEVFYKDKSDLYSTFSDLLSKENKLDSALYYTQLALDIDYSKNDSSSISNNLNRLGMVYSDQGKSKEALEQYYKCISYLTKNRDYHKAAIYSNIANIMLTIRNISKAEHYAKLALETAQLHDLTSYKAKVNSILGGINEINENYSKALEHIRISDEFNTKPNKLGTKINNAINKISCQLKLEMEIDTSQLSELIDHANGKLDGMTLSRIGYISLFYQIRSGINHDVFYKSFNRLKKIAEERRYLYSLRDLFQLEYKFLIDKNDYKKANQAILNYHTYVNDLFKERQEFLTLDLEAKYSKAKQDKQITLLAKDNLIQEVQLQQQRNYLIGGTIGLVIISILSFFIYRLYRKLIHQNTKITKALKEKDFLLREIHHRVKNNLQVISSLLSLQSRQIKDTKIKKAINEGRSRVRSMALIHQNLYQNENLSGVSVEKYMTKLVNELFDTYKIDHDKIQLDLDIETMELDVDTMVPLGLILNELVSNALKHAFPQNQNGNITISLNYINKNLLLKVKDNGIGTTLEQLEASESFGNRLIKAFSQKLKADLEVINANGTEVKMLIKNFKKVA